MRRGIFDDAHGVSSVPGIIVSLVDTDGEMPRDGGKNIATRADYERLSGILITDAPDERATPGSIKRQNTQKVLEAPREALRAVVVLRVGVTEFPACSNEHVLSGLDVNAGVNPGFVASQLDFLG